jgi:hypothetical protein
MNQKEIERKLEMRKEIYFKLDDIELPSTNYRNTFNIDILKNAMRLSKNIHSNFQFILIKMSINSRSIYICMS